jgi:membrane protease YdiL (CAAX protease family)
MKRQQIEAPGLSSATGTTLILLAVALSILIPTLLFLDQARAVVVMGASVPIVLGWAILRRQVMAVHVSLLLTLFMGWAWLGVWPDSWPFGGLAPLLAYALVVGTTPWLRGSTGWLRWGNVSRTAGWLSLVTVAVTAAALVLWVLVLNPDLSYWRAGVPDLSPVLLTVAIVGFALANGALEEVLYRGIVLHSLDSALGVGAASILIQGVAFGAFHFGGVPSGWVGVGLATVYGILLGAIRRASGGLLVPIVVHALADLVIAAILLGWAM